MSSRPRLTLDRRFALALVPITLLAVGGLVLLSRLVFEPEFEAKSRQELELTLTSRAMPLTGRWNAMVQGLESLAASGAEDGAGALPWDKAADAFLVSWPEVEQLYLLGSDGAGLSKMAPRGRWTERSPVPEAAWDAVAHGFSVIGSLRGHRVMDPAYCVHRLDGRDRIWLMRDSVDGTRVALALLREGASMAHLKALEQTEGAYAILLDAHGHELTTGSETPFHRSSAFTRELHVAGATTTTASLLDEDGERWLTAYHVDHDLGLTLAVSVPREVVFAPFVRWQRMALSLISIVLLFAAFSMHRMTMRVRDPLVRLASTMQTVARGDLTQRMPVEGQAEFADIARSFNTMISDLHTTHAAMRSQSDRLAKALHEVEDVEAMKDSFLALVSHEVRTPLTSIMGGVEFLRDEFADERTDIEREFIEIVYDSARRLSGFMNDAILMASLQANRSQNNFDVFSLTGLIKSKVAALEADCAKQKVVVENRVEMQREFFVLGDWTLMQVALEKILHNAVRHNHADGRVVIEFVERVLEDPDGDLNRLMTARSIEMPDGGMTWLALRVFNTGPVIVDEKIEQLFERFELTHDISNHQRGSGLSLPIANYVLGYHGGSIEVRPVGDVGMAFYAILAGRIGVDARRPDTNLPENVDETVAAAHLVQAAGHDIEELERQIEAAERAESEEDDAADRAQGALEEVLVSDHANVETPEP